METPVDLSERLMIVERQLRSHRVALVAAVVIASAVLVTRASSVGASQDQGIQRTRGLVIEDALGKDRIVIGAPVVEPAGRISPCTGLRINDPQGVERFAACLFNDGRVVVGLDAPVGKGDDRNRERITLVADAEGGAYVRFLNRKTGVPGRLVLGADDKLYLEFIQTVGGKARVKRISFDDEQMADLQ
jgi:hypothetical protein